jgi:hypothetical protein
MVGKSKISPALNLNKHHPQEDTWRSRDLALPFFTSALDGCEWSNSSSGRFTPRKIVPDIHFIKGCVGPRADLDTLEKRKISY